MVEVPLVLGGDSFKFKVHRFAQEELNAARKAAEKDARERGAKPKDLDSDEFLHLYALNLAPFIFRHLKGWDHTSETGAIVYAPEIAEALFSEMSEVEKAALGYSFLVQMSELGKKKEVLPNSTNEKEQNTGAQ